MCIRDSPPDGLLRGVLLRGRDPVPSLDPALLAGGARRGDGLSVLRGLLGEEIFVLAVSGDQHPLPLALTDHELEAEVARIDGDERRRSIIVLPRAHETPEHLVCR